MRTAGRVQLFGLAGILLTFVVLADAMSAAALASQQGVSADPSSPAEAAVDIESPDQQTHAQRRRQQQDTKETVYRVGVLAIRGFENAYKEFNAMAVDPILYGTEKYARRDWFHPEEFDDWRHGLRSGIKNL